jgi:nicotinamide mononucleotide transporter
MKTITKKILWYTSFIISALFLFASYKHWVSLQLTEVIGFVTGGYCVWLCVMENIWNWPIGILNAVAFTVLFLHSKLYADAGLQIVYIILNALGWYWWLKGGVKKTKLKVARIGLKESAILLCIGIIATFFFTRFLTRIGDVAPFWDGLTTVSSLIAQYMLTRKYLENWFVWIATDVIYIALYGSKHLVLTSVLYVMFMAMCFAGLRDWKKSRAATRIETPLVLTQKAHEA